MEICTLEEPKAAQALFDPIRNQLLSELREPESAAGLAARLKMPRQKVNYHLGELEKLGLVTLAEERTWGGITERRLVASGTSYVVSAKALGSLGTDPNRISDRLSANYLIAVAVRLANEVGDLIRRAKSAEKRLATLSIDTVISFGSATERAEFTEDFTNMMNELISRYHHPKALGSRKHRIIVGAHPLPTPRRQKE